MGPIEALYTAGVHITKVNIKFMPFAESKLTLK